MAPAVAARLRAVLVRLLTCLVAFTVVPMAAVAQTGPTDRAPASRTPTEASGSQDAASGAIRLSVSPARATVGRRTPFRFTATTAEDGGLPPRIDCTSASAHRGACQAQAGRQPVAGALVRFAGASARTDSRGHVTITRTLRWAGTFTARATKDGLDPGTTGVLAARRRRGGSGGGGGSGCRNQQNEQRASERDGQQCRRIGVAG